MLKTLSAIALAVALPAAAMAQTAPAAKPQMQAQTCMDHSKMAGMDHSKMMGSCATPPKTGATSEHQGHSGH